MVVNGDEIGSRVIGVVFVVTGNVADGAIWGGGFLLAGDRALRAPLPAAGVNLEDGMAPFPALSGAEKAAVEHQARTGLNAPPTSSMGRLFDAVASIAGVRHEVNYEGQAAIELEAIADP